VADLRDGGSWRPHPTVDGFYDREDAKHRTVVELFDRAAWAYPSLDRILSWGTGPRYRRLALERAGLRAHMKLLDVAAGTGLVSKAAIRLGMPPASIVGLDPSLPMLAEARRTTAVRVVRGVADDLPFRTGEFDFVSLGFALRHVGDLVGAFTEFRRVLKPGGKLLVLEIGVPTSTVGRRVVELYLGRLVPRVARVVTRSADAERLMQYYWATMERRVPLDAVRRALAVAGFDATTVRHRAGMEEIEARC